MKHWISKEEAKRARDGTRAGQKEADSLGMQQHGNEIHIWVREDNKKRPHYLNSSCWCKPLPGFARGIWVHRYLDLPKDLKESPAMKEKLAGELA